MKTNYINLDVLRALAVLSVVAQHMWNLSASSYWSANHPIVLQYLDNLSFTGVMIFFVHTCLVLMLSMNRAPDFCRGRIFLVRRAFRIYPLCWATILFVLTTGLTDHREANFHALGWRGITANFCLYRTC